MPEILSRDPERMARFKREAQVLASLNHPNIATIYGFEESDGVLALAMELVEGPTLAERLGVGRGALRAPEGGQSPPLPIDDALPIAKQIAEGLEYAHERGIIHRDLKPYNIKVTPEGTVKILDFGLAKALDSAGAAMSSSSPAAGTSPPQDSPTLTAARTEAGVILGTAAYMSPEQARGKSVDRRADIWSFGCVLFEMLSGRRLFEGESVSDTLAAVLKNEPDWDALPATTPPRICEVVRRCLVKDPKQRLRDIGDARIAIEDTISGVGAIHELPLRSKAGEHRSPLQRTLPWAAGIFVGAILAGLMAWRFVSSQAPARRPVTRFALTLPSGDQLANGDLPALALSPDGSEFVYVARHGDVTHLYVRSLNQLEPKPIAGTEGAICPFFSPDGQWIGFFADWRLKKISLKGGPPIIISDKGAPSAFGASWGANDTIIYSSGPGSLLQVSATGGTPRPVIDVNRGKGERTHRWPQILPGGDVLFNVLTGENWDEARIEIFSPRTGERHALAERGARPNYVPAGAIIYERGGDLMAVPFDLEALKETGSPTSVLEGVRTDSTSGAAQFSVSSEGSLVYIPGGTATPESTLVWVDRKGKEDPLPAPARQYLFASLSPDGSRVAVQIGEPDGDIWTYDLTRQTLTRLTTDGGNRRTVWSPDGKRVAYGSVRGSVLWNIYWAYPNGSGQERLTTSQSMELPASFSPDGRLLAFHSDGIRILPLYGDRKPQSFLQTGFDPMFSPDGHWMAYCDGETGREEIYLRPYPGPGEKLQVSNLGGIRPRWGQEGRELYYLEGNKVMRVAVTPGRELKLGYPQLLFEGGPGQWDGYASLATNDGKRFLMIKPQPSPPVTQIHVVLNWTDDLKHAVSTDTQP